MNFLKLLSLVFIIATTNCFSQEEEHVTDITKINVLSPGISYEKGIGRRQTLKLELLLAFSTYVSWSSSFGNSAGVNLDPAFGIQYRYYYNDKRREAKSRRTAMNSLNYIAATGQGIFVRRPFYDTIYSKSRLRLINTVGLLWGLQRNYHNRMSIDINAGLGYVFGKDLSSYFSHEPKGLGERFVLITGVKIGFWLNKRK